MSDRELLELAAKAAGMTVLVEGEKWPSDNAGWFFCVQHGIPALHNREKQGAWMPLNDDGDALRLAVKMRLRIDTPSAGSFRLRALVQSQDRTRGVCENSGDETIDTSDPYAATRRAIVRAAAEIGKAMP